MDSFLFPTFAEVILPQYLSLNFLSSDFFSFQKSSILTSQMCLLLYDV